MLNEVKIAKSMRDNGSKNQDISDKTGINKNLITALISLYEEMSDINIIDSKSSEYVRIKKKRYMMKSIKLQHKISDLREQYVNSMKYIAKKHKQVNLAIDKLDDIKDIKEELWHKQRMLNITSKNLQHAEDGYEFLKKEVRFNYATYFLYGFGAAITTVMLFEKFVPKSINIFH